MNKFETACYTNQVGDMVAYFQEFGAIYDMDNFYLSSVPFSVLSEYWLYLQPNGHNSQFATNADVNNAITSYLFDKELKSLLMDAVHDIEMSLKSVFIQSIYNYTQSPRALKNNSWISSEYANPNASRKLTCSKKIDKYKNFIARIKDITENDAPDYQIINKMSFGSVRCVYEILHGDVKKEIVSYYSMTTRQQFHSLLASLNSVRNKSAHYERTWNKTVDGVVRMPHPEHILYPVLTKDAYDVRKIYNTLVWMIYMLDKINPENEWKSKFLKLISKYEKHNYTKRMGFPDEWKMMKFWSGDFIF